MFTVLRARACLCLAAVFVWLATAAATARPADPPSAIGTPLPPTIGPARPATTTHSAFPLFHAQDGPTTQTRQVWAPWPLIESSETTQSLTFAIRPLFSWHEDRQTSETAMHILWPIIRRTYRPIAFKGEPWRVFRVFPVLYSGKGKNSDGEDVNLFYLFPILYFGSQGPYRNHAIIFPIYWYARDSTLIYPMFPSRPQTFEALFPLYGDFRGYWNRDRIRFILWPLFVWSEKGKGPNKVHIQSIVWPITGFYSGAVSGFRLWPLFSYVSRDGEKPYTRAYWLWPLGHHRSGQAPDERTTHTLTVFFPFYAHLRSRPLNYDMVFPFYGQFNSGKRTTKGYALAFYNTEESRRTGVKEHRLFWFIIRWRTLLDPEETDPIPPALESDRTETAAGDPRAPRPTAENIDPADESELSQESAAQLAATSTADEDDDDPGFLGKLFVGSDDADTSAARKPDPMLGWTFFPFYSRLENSQKLRSYVVWPIYSHNQDTEKQFVFERTYFVPFYSNQQRRWSDGSITHSSFFFPFFRDSGRRNGDETFNAFHLWWYDKLDGLDRNYAPLWTFYETRGNVRTGFEETRVLSRLYQRQTLADQTIYEGFNLLFFSTESSPQRAETSLFWGLFKTSREGAESKVSVLWGIEL